MVVKKEVLNSQILIGSSNDFQSFVNEFTSLEFNKKLTVNSDLSKEQVKQKLDIYLQEMMHGYHFVSQHLPKGQLLFWKLAQAWDCFQYILSDLDMRLLH